MKYAQVLLSGEEALRRRAPGIQLPCLPYKALKKSLNSGASTDEILCQLREYIDCSDAAFLSYAKACLRAHSPFLPRRVRTRSPQSCEATAW